MKIRLILVVSFCLFRFYSFGQEFSPSHLKTSEQFVQLLVTPEGLERTYESVFSGMLSQVPAEKKEPLHLALMSFMRKYAGYEVIKPMYAKIYAKEFSEAELKDMIGFFGSPVGRKYADISPRLLKQGMEFGQSLVGAHKEELQNLIQDTMTK